MIPPNHDAAAVYVAEFQTTSRSGARAFSGPARARRWIEVQVDQALDWHHRDAEWVAVTDYLVASVRRIPLHDPLTLRRRYPEAFDGDYTVE